MKMRIAVAFLVVCQLYSMSECQSRLSPEDLKQISLSGEKYLDKHIDNAINGVKRMKRLMEKSGEEHKKYLSILDRTKKMKEDALKNAQEVESKLNAEQEVCNETMQALWEECKPCLKNTCIKFYSRTCSSGSGMVGRQLEELLNRTTPMSIWINGERMDSLLEEDKEQDRRFEDLEEHYSEVADGVDSIFQDSMKVFDHMQSSFHHPFFSDFPRMPSFLNDEDHPFVRTNFPSSRFPMSERGFHGLFQPMFHMAQRMFDSANQYMEREGKYDTMPSSPTDGKGNEDVIVSGQNRGDRRTCREIRRNSAGCLKLKEECEKCKDILSIDCSGKRPLQGPLKEEFEKALAMFEKFTKEYDELLKKFQQEMLNTSSLMDTLNKQFGWVSTLANATKRPDEFFQIKTVISRGSQNPDNPGDTNVSVQLFDSPPMTFTVPGDIPWDDPKFSEVVAEEALERYKQNIIVVK
ncbi:clusterin-like isoform X1 [Acipenser ruthenus]|uniref:clusterin-like isoform X1 n=1 Tax=Acipenser ruthenus TaxID=7906 RepID=UPI00156024C0|nr:clusterin-like isoform X1 [Acipenser ruthenus]XP_033860466.2 clusterin-like isoform X1 [Acipenser ruthenus]XP_033860467.2 clusterin-like isoform X1 [Acipenser ruthenus]